MAKNSVGRKLRLTVEPKFLDELCDLLEDGCSIKTSCEVLSLSQSSFFEWLNRGRPGSSDYDPRFVEFQERVTRARGRGKVNLLRLIQKHAKHDGRLALELLSRLSPDEYGSRRFDGAGEESGAPPAQVTVVISDATATSPPVRFKVVDVVEKDVLENDHRLL